MARAVRDASGAILVLTALATLAYCILTLREHDYLAASFLLAAGLAILRAGVELLRPTVGE
ncbi:MAG: hypothetical protein IT378_24205 [Sandaracinaceae bacterium]|nr:hypothetical protein [Sandaracinaceae bacterium]MCC6877431.1 hypothetical protein [Sandaracinaceae bacterium]